MRENYTIQKTKRTAIESEIELRLTHPILNPFVVVHIETVSSDVDNTFLLQKTVARVEFDRRKSWEWRRRRLQPTDGLHKTIGDTLTRGDSDAQIVRF